MKALGVDGCRTGWVAVAHCNGSFTAQVFAQFDLLMQMHDDADRIYIDIPIGLPHRGQTKRPCDAQARKNLGPRAASIFSPPCRAAVYADNYNQAKAINEAELGVRFSIQAWGICRKIAEVDRHLRANPEHLERIHEAHPELAFWALNAHCHLRATKKTPEGQAERISLLEATAPGASAWLKAQFEQSLRSQYAKDDLLDAMALCLRARDIGELTPPAMGAATDLDACGLPMCIRY
jgi:predicted RNase H-like nuclease